MVKKIFKFIRRNETIAIIFMAIGFFAFGIYIGFSNQPTINKITSISNKNSPNEIKADFETFWKVWSTINEKYPSADKITDQERLYGAISGLVGSLNDPYSVFFNPVDTKTFQDDIKGTFSGVGMEVGNKDKILTVIAPLKDTPAYKAGIKSGDKILKIDATITSDLSMEKAIALIRGEKGTEVSLTIFRNGEKEPREIKIIRDIINTPTIETELRKDNIFVIKLFSFSANSANLFREAMKEFYESRSDKLLLDLRGNPGGYLDASVNMASWFLPSGKTVVIEDYANDTKQKNYRSAGYNIFNDKLKFVILIDSGSASASEILAGAMQDYGKAKLVGDKSYGKGSVQEVVNITPETILKITVAKWLTPNGNSISDKGLTPDYEVKFTQEDNASNILAEKIEKDPQMDKAIELLNNWIPIVKDNI
ncbi:MAG: S41 family peptidase [Candidatus Paceibacterota bacterium]